MFPLAFVAGWLQGHWWGFISRNYVVWPTFLLMNVFIALKGSHFWFLFIVSINLFLDYSKLRNILDIRNSILISIIRCVIIHVKDIQYSVNFYRYENQIMESDKIRITDTRKSISGYPEFCVQFWISIIFIIFLIWLLYIQKLNIWIPEVWYPKSFFFWISILCSLDIHTSGWF